MCAARAICVAALSAILAACAQTAPTLEYIEGPKLRTLESAYDRAKWRWVRNADGRPLLVHTEVARCFVDPEPPLDVHDSGFTVKRGGKTIGAARYETVTVFDKDDFWEAVYTRSGTSEPILSVYAPGRCQEEAERILQRYEDSLAAAGKRVKSRTGENR